MRDRVSLLFKRKKKKRKKGWVDLVAAELRWTLKQQPSLFMFLNF